MQITGFLQFLSTSDVFASSKLRTYLEDINAVEIKLNGRINPETILLKAVR